MINNNYRVEIITLRYVVKKKLFSYYFTKTLLEN